MGEMGRNDDSIGWYEMNGCSESSSPKTVTKNDMGSRIEQTRDNGRYSYRDTKSTE